MSMTMLTVLQIICILVTYLGVALALPWLFLRKKLEGFRVPARVMAYLLIGNFYIINLVYLLQLLHISCRLTLIVGTIAPFAVKAFLKYRGSFSVYFEQRLRQAALFFGGETGKKTLALKVIRKIKALSAERRHLRTAGDRIDFLLTGGVIFLVFYMYGSNALFTYGYSASDVVVHNDWINEMGRNNIFAGGVCPFGMHCMLYYLHTVFSIPVYVVLRLFWVVQTMFVHLMLLFFLKLVCKSRYAPYIGVIAYLLSDIFYVDPSYSMDSYYRYYASLPQEFGMIFILPAVYFLIVFFQRKMFATGSKEQDIGDKKQELYLILFAIGFSLTITTHFYDAIALGFFCVGAALGFCFRCFRRPYLKRILPAGLAGITIAVFPMAAAYVMGKPLNRSLDWGMSVISAKSTGGIVSGNGSLFGEIAEKLRWALGNILYHIQHHITGGDITAAKTVLICVGVLLFLGSLWMFCRVEYGAVLISATIFMVALSVQLAAATLGIPQLMDLSVCSVYFAYGVGMMWSLMADAVAYLLFLEKKAINRCALAILAVCCAVVVYTGIREPARVAGYESNDAVLCLTNIIRENKNGGTWTICSANDEKQMMEDNGYHYEMIEFLREMETLDEDTVITIPTSTVYFFIEKIPLEYGESISTFRPNVRISEEKAKERLSEESGIGVYWEEDRLITMSRMYYWAQAFRELFPNEMEVYYESDEFICYRVKQNEYNCYNFAIDYGYNGAGASNEIKTPAQGG